MVDVLDVLHVPLTMATRSGGWVLDGVPRTVDQAAALDDALDAIDAAADSVVVLEVPDPEVRARLAHRARVEHRADDTEEVITHRLAVWAVGVRAVQRAHRPARQPRRGRAARPARHLPELGLRAAAAAVRRGRLRLPRVGPDDHQRHQRQADPAAGRRRAVRRALRPPRQPRARARPARRRPAPRRRVDVARRATGAGRARPGWSRSPSAPSPPSATRSRPVDEPARVVVQSELVANEPLPAPTSDPRVAAALRGAARAARSTPLTAPARSWSTAPGAAGCGVAAAMDHVVEAPDGVERRASRPSPDVGRVTVATRARAGRDAAGREVPRLRLVEPSGRARRCATRSMAALAGAQADGLGRAPGRAARLPRRVLGRRRRRDRRRRRAAAGRALRAVPRPAGRRPGRGAGRSPPRA